MTPTFDAIVALWRAGLAAGDPAPRVRLSSLAVGQLQAELPGVPSSALAGLAELPPCCVLRLDRNLPDGSVLDVRPAPAAEPADMAPAVHLGGQDDAPRPVQLPPFRWEDVLKAMPPPPPVRPAGIPHPLGPDPSPGCATKESPTSPVNDVGPPPSTQPAHRSGQTLAPSRRTGKPARCNRLRFSIAGQRPKETMNALDTSNLATGPGLVITGNSKNSGPVATNALFKAGTGLVATGNHFRPRHNASAQERRNRRRAIHRLVGAGTIIILDEPHRFGKRGGK